MSAEFWNLEQPAEKLAVIAADTGVAKTYAQLREDVRKVAALMPSGASKSLLLLLAHNRYESLVTYLAALNRGHALLLVDATLNHDLLDRLVETYKPDYAYASGPTTIAGYREMKQDELYVLEREAKHAGAIDLSLALLLNTSGSTGSPKLVRLSRANLQENASSIARYLELNAEDKPITSLPMAYSYGLSVLNSHLLAGATIVLTEHGVLRREFWDAIDRHGCTSFAGVPYTYQMLIKTGLLKKRGATLRTLTQAGGALAPEYIQEMHQVALQRGFKFFVMYGQTEATARIAYVPFESLAKKIGSIGISIPDGSLEVDPTTNELVYSGPNVMLGYAESRDDLAKGDELNGVLRTGDLARRDADGFFYVTGRIKRFLKLFGKRFSLDEVEQIVQRRFGVAVASFGRDDLLMLALEGDGIHAEDVAGMVRETFGLPNDAIRVEVMPKLPRTDRGKTDYQALATANAYVAAATQSALKKVEIGTR